jgi:hypothetical protein
VYFVPCTAPRKDKTKIEIFHFKVLKNGLRLIIQNSKYLVGGSFLFIVPFISHVVSCRCQMGKIAVKTILKNKNGTFCSVALDCKVKGCE